MDLIQLEDKAKREELALLYVLEQIPSAGGKRDKCKELNVPWDEYLRLSRKWRLVIERYRKEKGDEQTKS
jgi:hypothetical protein